MYRFILSLPATIRLFLITCILAPSSWGLTGLNVSLHQQLNDSLCWAGVSQSVLEYYGATISQSDIRSYATNGSDATVRLFGSQNTNRKSIDQILSHYKSIASAGIWDTITLEAIKGQINNDKPIIAFLQYIDLFYLEWYTVGHFVTIIGYSGNSIEYIDPKYNDRTYGDIFVQYNTFNYDNAFSSYYDNTARQTNYIGRLWTGTLTLTTPPPLQPAVVGNFGPTISKIMPVMTIINSLLLRKR